MPVRLAGHRPGGPEIPEHKGVTMCARSMLARGRSAGLGKLCVVWPRRIVVPGHGKIDRMAIGRGGL